MDDDKLAQAAQPESARSSNGNGNVNSSVEEDDNAQLQAELDQLRNENRELNDKTLRLVAEMENIRRRTERDKTEFSKYAISEFARELLSVGDNIRRAIESVQSDNTENPTLRNLLEGIEVTERELLKAFEKHQVVRFNPEGEPFNPHLHDAMTRIEVPNVAADTVVQVVQAGYMISERVLRPAAVIVAKGNTGAVAQPKEKQEKPAPEPELPPGATMVPEEVQAVNEQAAHEREAESEPKTAKPVNRGEGRAASGREFQVERKRSAAGPGPDERASQIRRQPRPPSSVDTPRNNQPAGKPSALHKPVINSGNE
ncbi:MAG: nucleotide exchange factor GrpE [Hyphomicrobiales bacterium]|nr:nucleotide exchange factor GrpE [Hyphomicrobiales bacterium]